MRMYHTKYGYVSKEEAQIDGDLERYFKHRRHKEQAEKAKPKNKQEEKGDGKHDKHSWV